MKNPSLWICETHSSADGKKTNGATPTAAQRQSATKPRSRRNRSAAAVA